MATTQLSNIYKRIQPNGNARTDRLENLLIFDGLFINNILCAI